MQSQRPKASNSLIELSMHTILFGYPTVRPVGGNHANLSHNQSIKESINQFHERASARAKKAAHTPQPQSSLSAPISGHMSYVPKL
jgi:hypothetical protein